MLFLNVLTFLCTLMSQEFAFREIEFQLWQRRQTQTLDLNIPLKIKGGKTFIPPESQPTRAYNHQYFHSLTILLCLKFNSSEDELWGKTFIRLATSNLKSRSCQCRWGSAHKKSKRCLLGGTTQAKCYQGTFFLRYAVECYFALSLIL